MTQNAIDRSALLAFALRAENEVLNANPDFDWSQTLPVIAENVRADFDPTVTDGTVRDALAAYWDAK